jgi:hypothetical protein
MFFGTMSVGYHCMNGILKEVIMQNEKKFYTLTDAEFAFMAAVAVITLILTWRYVW